MKTYLISDTHISHKNVIQYCNRPENFEELIEKRWKETVGPEDLVIHLGDVSMASGTYTKEFFSRLPGRKTLIRGNHDKQHSNMWWMEHGFDFSCDAMIYRGVWLTHRPSEFLPAGCTVNFHGHYHLWLENGGHKTKPDSEWQRLLSIEYCDYRPVDFDKFLARPKKYKATGVE